MTSSPRATPDQGSAELPPLPEAKVMVRETDEEVRSLENGGWIVDCDCEGPLSYSLEANEALYTADQMREYGRAILAAATQPAPSEEPKDREKFEAWLRARWPAAVTPIDAKTPAGFYVFSENNILWEAYQQGLAAATQGAPRVDLRAAIMNLPADKAPADWQHAHWYELGHCDARHAAAELVAAQGAPTPAQDDAKENDHG